MKPLLIGVGIAIVVGILIALLGLMTGLFYVQPFTLYFLEGSQSASNLALFNVYFIVAIPLIFVIAGVVQLMTRRKLDRRIAWSMVGFMILNVISLNWLGVDTFKQFSFESDYELLVTEDLDVPTLHVVMNSDDRNGRYRLGHLRFDQQGLTSEDVQVRFKSTDKPTFRIKRNVKARGNNESSGLTSAAAIQHDFNLERDQFSFNEVFTLPEGHKWRGHEVDIEIEVPEGKSVQFGNSLNRGIRTKDGYHRGRTMKDKKFKMTADGFELVVEEQKI